jgi:putative oxidoreductase
MRKLALAGRWILQVFLGAMFVLIGTAKFFEPSWASRFARWGFPPGFHLVIGALEVVGGIALLVPAVASYAALGLIVIMIGASLTHLTHGEMARVGAPVPFMVLLAVLALARRSSARRLVQRPPAREVSVV